MKRPLMLLISILLCCFYTGYSQNHHMNDHNQMNKNGNQVMGFDQKTTTHHFTLTQNGGSIQVTANDSDTTTVQHICAHLNQVSKAFANGDFSMPEKVHSQVPPGTATMIKLKKDINYEYSDIPNGGIVKITTNNKEALSAVHQFLKFQIREHKTGDPTSVQK